MKQKHLAMGKKVVQRPRSPATSSYDTSAGQASTLHKATQYQNILGRPED